MDDEQKTWTMDDSARASNPGNLKADLICWARHYPLKPLILGAGVSASVAMSFLAPKGGYWIIAIIFLVLSFYHWQRIR